MQLPCDDWEGMVNYSTSKVNHLVIVVDHGKLGTKLHEQGGIQNFLYRSFCGTVLRHVSNWRSVIGN